MRLDKALCKPWAGLNKFGNSMRGYWQCNSHTTRKYYPTPIKNAVKGEYNDNDYPEVGLVTLYKAVAEKGHPWKCPLCDNFLRYFDEGEDMRVIG